MAVFRYSMQSILDIKLKMETQAKQEFAAAKNRLDEEEKRLAEFLARKEAYEEEARKLLTGILKVRDIEDNKNAILMMEQYIAEQKKRVKRAADQVEKARQKLADVMKERKMQETLREKAFESFLEEEKRQEGKAVDELTSYTYSQQRQVNG